MKFRVTHTRVPAPPPERATGRAAVPPACRPCLAGTELKAMLRTIGIADVENCACAARAREMDARGCDWCAANVDTITGWLREEAQRRGLPFLDTAGRLLVRAALRRARRKAERAAV